MVVAKRCEDEGWPPRAFDVDTDLPTGVPPAIRHSWMRSRLAHVPQDRIDLPFAQPAAAGDRLRLAAEPVLGRFAQQLDGTQIGIVLADRDARVVGRWAGERSALRRLAGVSIEEGFVLAEEFAGTNGVGTTLETLAPVAIRGAEHYSESWRGFVCVGVPLRHPLTRRLEGVLNLSCPVREENPLLLPTVLDLGSQIEHELASRSSLREQAVFEEFLARSRSTSSALVALADQFMLTNAPAASRLQPSDQALLWNQAAEAFSEATTVVRSFRLSTGEDIRARCTPVRVAGRAIGALIEVDEDGPRSPSSFHLDGAVAGYRSRAWLRIERVLAGFDLGPGARLRILGEEGTGKATLADRIHRRLAHAGTGPRGELTEVGCESPALDDEDLDGIARRLREPSGALLIRGVDRLEAPAAHRVLDLLDDAPAPPFVVTTGSPGDDGRYRALDHRFGQQVLRVPPLRERRDDIPDLVYEMIRHADVPVRRVTHPAMAALMSYEWPGNVRQLAATLAEAVAVSSGPDLDLSHLPGRIRAGGVGRRKLSKIEQVERDAIAESLRANDGNKIRTAEHLGMSRSTLYRRLRRFGLDVDRSLV
ncbi:Fis family transcriptional regulator [Actinomycetospora sp. NBRC 106375]|uniref:sigma-54-dependent Fis family transcriptional regulator n=1 Tax=Actinomycetospora sp. NBRC 106375 TaxID=3032207 RepID=UPI0024A4E004|nr:helix-turn-helix domain-containing protein [Actinomycetospora sp. NBRC 106375]GLZ49338.1 Fis family transcriptional regulator [Actinomycetospora sp. NBRC 106375]